MKQRLQQELPTSWTTDILIFWEEPFAAFLEAPLLGAEVRDCIRARASFSAAINVPNILRALRVGIALQCPDASAIPLL